MALSSLADSAKDRGVISDPFRADEYMCAANPGRCPGLSHLAPSGPFDAATRQDVTAQGNALGSTVKKQPSPEGAKHRWGRPFRACCNGAAYPRRCLVLSPDAALRPKSRLIPHIAFIEHDPVLVQQPPVFLLERHHAMMVRLSGDVSLHLGAMGRADGENPITALPMELRQQR